MKKTTATLLLLLFFFVARGQYIRPEGAVSGDYHTHKGFHFEFGLGPAFGIITDDGTFAGGHYVIDFSGTGFGIDIRVGGFVQENLALTFDVISKAVSAPTLTLKGISVATSSDYSISEVTYGGGLTYYLMPSDIFFSATLGTGAFVSQSNVSGRNITSRTDYGFSFQLKAGKHWWISNKWGISLSGAFGTTSASDSGVDVNGIYTDNLSSSRFTISVSIGNH